MVGDREWTATADVGELIQETEQVRVVGVYANDLLKVTKVTPEKRRLRIFSLGKIFGGKDS